MNTKTLDLVASGTTVRIVSLSGGRHAREKLRGLGFIPGERVKVRRNDFGGPLVVEIYGSRTVLGLGLAQKVKVVEMEAAWGSGKS
jgi:Fe2+ transport system protein FeoA